MDLIGKDEHFHVGVPFFPEALNEVGSLDKVHISVVIAMDKKDGRIPESNVRYR